MLDKVITLAEVSIAVVIVCYTHSSKDRIISVDNVTQNIENQGGNTHSSIVMTFCKATILQKARCTVERMFGVDHKATVDLKVTFCINKLPQSVMSDDDTIDALSAETTLK